MTLSAELALQAGEFALDVAFELDGHAALLGPNGSGKSTVLELLSGLRVPQRGRITLGGETLLDTARRVARPPAARRIGQVLQDGALFPHLTVAQNVAWPLRIRRRRDPAVVAGWLARFELDALAGQYPATLSGGERQRVALARALAAEPRWLLLDEPFAALDAAARPPLRQQLVRLLDELGIPALLVTHDAQDALGLGGQVLVLEAGRLVEQGAAATLLREPASAFSAALMGFNYLLGTVTASAAGLLTVAVGDGTLRLPGERAVGEAVAAVVSPREIILSAEPLQTSAQNQFRGHITAVRPDGSGTLVTLDGPVPLTVWVTPSSVADLHLAVGAEVTALFKTSAARLC